MLGSCVDECPGSAWLGPVGNWKCCQVAFHTLFFTDLYLGTGVKACTQQPFHDEHRRIFEGYEELEDRPPVLEYEKTFIRAYLLHCLDKIPRALAEEDEASLAAPSPFKWLPMTRAEVYACNIRHIQHHAGQLSLRFKLDHAIDIPWVKVGSA
jgi:hypothetical protein